MCPVVIVLWTYIHRSQPNDLGQPDPKKELNLGIVNQGEGSVPSQKS